MLKRRRILTKDNFEQLLVWLNPEREQAANRYEAIRTSLIRILTWRGCNNAEDLADETINRVAEKVHLLKETYVGDPAIYFYAVAKRLAKGQIQRSLLTRATTLPGFQTKRPGQRIRCTSASVLACGVQGKKKEG